MVTVVGARPQFIKAAAVSRALAGQDIEEVLVHTGQHYDTEMSDVFFQELGLPNPDHHLGIGSARHGEQTGRMLAAIERLLLEVRPACVLVYGDTNSTLAGALAAAKLHMPVAHVEAGLRSFNRRMAEEVNRVVTDHLSEWLFVPTAVAMGNIAREGLGERSCHLVGDVMYDMTLWALEKDDPAIRVGNGKHVLVTIHRAENTDDPVRLQTIVEGLRLIGTDFPVTFPLHPRTRGALERLDLLKDLAERINLRPPAGYLEMLRMQRGAIAILTDSGGLQKEAYFQRIPCITVREETEWVELVEHGWNRLAPPTDAAAIAQAVRSAISSGRGEEVELYGGGHAAERIAEILVQQLK